MEDVVPRREGGRAGCKGERERERGAIEKKQKGSKERGDKEKQGRDICKGWRLRR